MNIKLPIDKLQHDIMYRKYEDENINNLALIGDLEGIKFLTSMGYTCTSSAIDWAASNGHLEIVKWLHENHKDIKGFTYTPSAMDWASLKGHLETVKFLHENGYSCTTAAMDYASENGHLEIVKWLHENRTEGCTPYAMNWTAKNGHLEIVEYLKSIQN